MEATTITIRDLDGRTRSLEVGHAKTNERVESIEERLDRAARAFYFAGTAFVTLAGVVVGAIFVH